MIASWAAAAVIVEGEYHTSSQEHAYLQPEAGLAYIDDEGRVTVVVAGQWTWEDQQEIAHALDLPPEQVRRRRAAPREQPFQAPPGLLAVKVQAPRLLQRVYPLQALPTW